MKAQGQEPQVDSVVKVQGIHHAGIPCNDLGPGRHEEAAYGNRLTGESHHRLDHPVIAAWAVTDHQVGQASERLSRSTGELEVLVDVGTRLIDADLVDHDLRPDTGCQSIEQQERPESCQCAPQRSVTLLPQRIRHLTT